jgi:hypothetical protein
MPTRLAPAERAPAIRAMLRARPDLTDHEVARCLGLNRWSLVRRVREALAVAAAEVAPAWACASCGGTDGQAISDPTRCKPCVRAANTPAAAPTVPAAPAAPATTAAPTVPAAAPAPATAPPLPAWARHAAAVAAEIAHEPDPCERDMLRLALLKTRYTPWKG